MNKIKLLFVISNLNIGGPQKSLLALTDEIDYTKFDVDILVLNQRGTLKKYFNSNINFLELDELAYAATLPKTHIFKSLWTFLKHGEIKMFIDSLKSILKKFFPVKI